MKRYQNKKLLRLKISDSQSLGQGVPCMIIVGSPLTQDISNRDTFSKIHLQNPYLLYSFHLAPKFTKLFRTMNEGEVETNGILIHCPVIEFLIEMTLYSKRPWNVIEIITVTVILKDIAPLEKQSFEIIFLFAEFPCAIIMSDIFANRYMELQNKNSVFHSFLTFIYS